MIQLDLGEVGEFGYLLGKGFDLIVSDIEGLHFESVEKTGRQFLEEVVPDVELLQVDQLDHAVDILDLVATEDQSSQVAEIVADIVDTRKVIVG